MQRLFNALPPDKQTAVMDLQALQTCSRFLEADKSWPLDRIVSQILHQRRRSSDATGELKQRMAASLAGLNVLHLPR